MSKPPPALPTATPVLNKVLGKYGLRPVAKMGELCVGDLTLIAGTPETDLLPETAEVTYIGPILWRKPGASLSDWVDSLDPGKPVFRVYSGDPRYLRGIHNSRAPRSRCRGQPQS